MTNVAYLYSYNVTYLLLNFKFFQKTFFLLSIFCLLIFPIIAEETGKETETETENRETARTKKGNFFLLMVFNKIDFFNKFFSELKIWQFYLIDVK